MRDLKMGNSPSQSEFYPPSSSNNPVEGRRNSNNRRMSQPQSQGEGGIEGNWRDGPRPKPLMNQVVNNPSPSPKLHLPFARSSMENNSGHPFPWGNGRNNNAPPGSSQLQQPQPSSCFVDSLSLSPECSKRRSDSISPCSLTPMVPNRDEDIPVQSGYEVREDSDLLEFDSLEPPRNDLEVKNCDGGNDIAVPDDGSCSFHPSQIEAEKPMLGGNQNNSVIDIDTVPHHEKSMPSAVAVIDAQVIQLHPCPENNNFNPFVETTNNATCFDSETEMCKSDKESGFISSDAESSIHTFHPKPEDEKETNCTNNLLDDVNLNHEQKVPLLPPHLQPQKVSSLPNVIEVATALPDDNNTRSKEGEQSHLQKTESETTKTNHIETDEASAKCQPKLSKLDENVECFYPHEENEKTAEIESSSFSSDQNKSISVIQISNEKTDCGVRCIMEIHSKNKDLHEKEFPSITEGNEGEANVNPSVPIVVRKSSVPEEVSKGKLPHVSFQDIISDPLMSEKEPRTKHTPLPLPGSGSTTKPANQSQSQEQTTKKSPVMLVFGNDSEGDQKTLKKPLPPPFRRRAEKQEPKSLVQNNSRSNNNNPSNESNNGTLFTPNKNTVDNNSLNFQIQATPIREEEEGGDSKPDPKYTYNVYRNPVPVVGNSFDTTRSSSSGGFTTSDSSSVSEENRNFVTPPPPPPPPQIKLSSPSEGIKKENNKGRDSACWLLNTPSSSLLEPLNEMSPSPSPSLHNHHTISAENGMGSQNEEVEMDGGVRSPTPLSQHNQQHIPPPPTNNETNNPSKDLSRVLAEYEKTVATYGKKMKEMQDKFDKSEDDKKNLIREREQAMEDLANVETAFSDLHRKYERSKAVLANLKDNETVLLSRDKELAQKLELRDQKLQMYKERSEEKVEQLYMDYEAKLKESEAENVRLKAQVRLLEMKLNGLENDVEQKAKENAQLSALCNELINGKGPTDN